MRKILLFTIFVLFAGSAMAAVSHEALRNGGGSPAKPAALPNTQLRVHDVGKIRLSVTNFGFFGSQGGDFEDAGGYYLLAPGCEFPGGIIIFWSESDSRIFILGLAVQYTRQMGR